MADTLDTVSKSISADFRKCKPLNDIAGKARVEPGKIVIGSFLFISILTLLGFGSEIWVALIGFLYPAYCSLKAIETPEEDDNTQWFTYWIVFAVVSASDYLISMFVEVSPLVQFFKLILYVWLFYPKSRGAIKVYNSTLKNLLNRVQPGVELVIGQLIKGDKN